MDRAITQYDLLSTSTCVSIGAGGTRCVYEYKKEISTTTESSLYPDLIATTTANFEVVGTVGILFTIGIVIAVIVAGLVRKFT